MRTRTASKKSVASTDEVFRRLLDGILSGAYAAGTRLPAERELARTVGASRATLREALRRLEAWRLVAPRRGSGIEVRDFATQATLDVLPAYLRSGVPGPAAACVLVDMLQLRRRLMTEIMRLICGRVAPGQLDGARAAAARAAAAADHLAFVHADLAAVRAIAFAADFLPAVWMLNSFEGVYLELASGLVAVGAWPPDPDYLAIMNESFDALEAGDGERAVTVLDRYLGRHDRRMASALGLPEPSRRGRGRAGG